MKLKLDPVYPSFFYSTMMSIDIDIEIAKLNKFVNNKEIPLFDDYELAYNLSKIDIQVKYLLYVLEFTCNNPGVEAYLEQLLENYSIEELNNLDNYCTNILHYMMLRQSSISVNSFEIIINFGIDVNQQNYYKVAPLHMTCNEIIDYEHEKNIIALFVKHGANLNILNFYGRTILDNVVGSNKFCKNLKIIMLLIDFGAKTNYPYDDTDENVLEFVESYRSSTIKPAIKK